MSAEFKQEKKHVKIAFELEQDPDGYPPDKCETMWAIALEQEDTYWLDNIPVFAKGVSSEDVVRASLAEDRLRFEQVLHSSGNSVIRVFVKDVADVQSSRERFRELGCASELSYVPRLFAIEIPRDKPGAEVLSLLEEDAASGKWEYEVGVLRHEDKPGPKEVVS